MGKLTTHVLDTMHGKPAPAVAYQLKKIDSNNVLSTAKEGSTNDDGRCSAPLLEGDELQTGHYQLVFNVEEYFGRLNVDCPFLKQVVIQFYVEDPSQHFHVPLLISPYSYSTYRGS